MKKKENNTLVYILIAAALVVMAFSVYTLINANYYGSDYQKAVSSELEDICATPPGYTDESWRQHMSHHPDMYAECLK